MSKKKAIGIGLLAVITTLSLVACGKEPTSNPSSSSSPAAKELEPATISLFYSSAPPKVKLEESEYGKQILSKLKVTLNTEYVSKDASTREGVLVSSNDYPDLIIPQSNSQENSGLGLFLKAKALIPLDDLIEKYGKNIKKWYPGNELDKYKKDGKLYTLPLQPGYENPSTVGSGYWIQEAVLKDAGWPKIKTFDEYFALLEKYRAKYPQIGGKDTIGYSFQSEGYKFDWLTNQGAYLSGYRDDGGFMIDVNGKKATAKQVAGSDVQKQHMQKMNEYFSKGLVDQEGFVDKIDQWKAKMSSGRVLGYYGGTTEMGSINDALTKQGLDDRRFVYIPLVFKDGIQEKYWGSVVPNVNAGIGISKSAKNPERIMQFLDGLMSEEIMTLRQWGVKDVDYTIGSDGKNTVTPEQIELYRDADKRNAKGFPSYNLFPQIPSSKTFSNGSVYSISLTKEYISTNFTNSDKEYLKAYGYTYFSDAFKKQDSPYGAAYTVNITGDSDAGKANTKRNDIVRTYIPKMLLAKPADFNKIWDEYVAKLKDANMKPLEDYISNAITKRLEEGRQTD
ncbi:type 2 periplasmic-binding domain-containing protein [Paenibacillus roseipurpureus]|uniref:ABC transporter substrate-binding protein n=1 Tax=Paenibacillus roseopurpureus TaxID=2918901 RepID=A0AA96LKA6_9BACL|nr:hypothetical protein [Paenibacillus sp. MBLB1832]WNR43472.1 hypothetical protein MJB10_20530 [Paenibacillus sp. MBLB1832]